MRLKGSCTVLRTEPASVGPTPYLLYSFFLPKRVYFSVRMEQSSTAQETGYSPEALKIGRQDFLVVCVCDC